MKLVLWMSSTSSMQDQQLPGTAAAYDLQWVMLVYTALLVGRLHQQQQGITPVQLHTTQPATKPSASAGTSSSTSSSRQGLGLRSGSASTSRQSSSKKALHAQQASSSSAAAGTRPAQGSVVPPYHLQVLRVAGVSPHRIEHLDELPPGSEFVSLGMLPAAAKILHIVLEERRGPLKLARRPQTAASGLETSSVSNGSRSSTPNGNSSSTTCGSSSSAASTSSTSGSSSATSGSGLSGSSSACNSNSAASGSSLSGSSNAASSSPSAGSAAAVQALLAPCSLMLGELLALHVNTGSNAANSFCEQVLMDVLVYNLWRSSMSLYQLVREQQTIEASQQQQQEPLQQEPLQQQHRVSETRLQDSWYKSCVEFIVPSLLHMRAAGITNAAEYALTATHLFEGLKRLLLPSLPALNSEFGC